MKVRIVDEAISQAWLEAAKDLGIRVVAPFKVQGTEPETATYEAHILDFGGPRGTVAGVLDDQLHDCRVTHGSIAQTCLLPIGSTTVSISLTH
jgi:hypothetical protein